MNYAQLVELYEKLEQNLLLLQGRVFSRNDERKLGVAAKLVIKAIRAASGHDEKEVMSAWKKRGDLGEVAAELLANKKQVTLLREELTVTTIFDALRSIATFEGAKSQDRKLQTIARLLNSS